MDARTRRWSQLSSGQRVAIIVLASVELALTTAALVDLLRRPATEVRGPKLLWGVAVFVQPIGPISYLTLGRRRSTG